MEGRESKRGDESQESAVISHETKAHTARLWLWFHTSRHLSVPPRLRALRGLLRGVQLKQTETESKPQQRQFHPSRHLRTTVSFWTTGMELRLDESLQHSSGVTCSAKARDTKALTNPD
ncbi:hypothetical protein NQZ68_011345 [Dissostichus eleginoides]|nr:hypothetical protein NQZ68_011345 [Dissostichus eleginoides]